MSNRQRFTHHTTVELTTSDYELLKEAREAQRRLHKIDAFEPVTVNLSGLFRAYLRAHCRDILIHEKEIMSGNTAHNPPQSERRGKAVRSDISTLSA